MCMEDYQIGRKTVSNEFNVVATAVGNSAIPYDEFRTCLILCAPAAGGVTYTLAMTPVVGSGIRITAGGSPVVFDLIQHGDIVRKQWNVISDAGNVNTTIYAVSLR